jgi:hypothetical protein
LAGAALVKVCLALATHSALARDLPDLIITNIQLQSSGGCGSGGALITGRIDVKNIGQGRGQIFTTREMIRSHIRGEPRIRGGDRFVNSMRPGETVSVDVRIGTKGPYRITGRRTVVLEVDPEKVFKEEDETNNTATADLVLSCP